MSSNPNSPPPPQGLPDARHATTEPSEPAAPTTDPQQTIHRESTAVIPTDPDQTVRREPSAPSSLLPHEANTVLQSKPPVWPGHLNATATHPSPSDQELRELEQEIEQSQQDQGQALAGDHELIRPLGHGSFGIVWEAKNRHTGEHVAIKFFRAEDADWAKLLNEVGVVQRVEGCRGIVLVKEVRPGSPGCRPYYVMPLANRGSLADWIKNAGNLSSSERLRMAEHIFARVARAMAVVHRRGIHHCDLKPHNILLHATEENAVPEPLVADFGQAHLANDRSPAHGTFFYMPPDQIDAIQTQAPPDTRWDVYALGAVVYEMITGDAPRRTPELLQQIKDAPKNLTQRMAIYRAGILAAPPPTAHHRYCDSMLATIIDRCLALQPDRRPADAGAVLQLLQARDRWRRTRPLLGWAIAATILVITMALAVAWWWAQDVTERVKRDVTAELSKSLARTSGFAARAVEDRLQKNILLLEHWAEDVHSHNPAVIRALAQAAAIPRRAQLTECPVLPQDEHQELGRWLLHLHRQRVRLMGHTSHFPTLGVMLVTADADSSTPESRGFFLARVLQNGRVEDWETSRGTVGQAIYHTDLSYRDYFHVGSGETEHPTTPHRVVRYSHISRPFRSRGNDFTGKAIEAQRWKFNIVTPLWNDPHRRERIIGLLVLGFDVENDLVPLLDPSSESSMPSQSAVGDLELSYNIHQLTKVVVTDHRGHWIWHPDAREVIESKQSALERLPAYPTLIREFHYTRDQAGPWAAFVSDQGDGPSFSGQPSDSYIDPLETKIDGDRDEEIAAFVTFNPFAASTYTRADREHPAAPPRPWLLIAQIDKKQALKPLDDLEHRIILRGGATVVGIMTLIAAGLWIGLIWVLRRLDGSSSP
ncbi:MAG: serine/threonine-protein kinase [Gemmataceae bacterium]|nr:serine/threonine protein kinase [Gemmata sp.]MDW8196158.1 serine/threonine-protein kinase [Gemmataceae bacterium]